jgi:hypothetical protein
MLRHKEIWVSKKIIFNKFSRVKNCTERKDNKLKKCAAAKAVNIEKRCKYEGFDVLANFAPKGRLAVSGVLGVFLRGDVSNLFCEKRLKKHLFSRTTKKFACAILRDGLSLF